MLKQRLLGFLALLLVFSLVLTACQPGSPEIVEVTRVVVEEKEKEVEVTRVVVEEKEIQVTVEVEVPVEATMKPLKMWASYDLTDTANPPSVTLSQAINTFQSTTGIQVEYEQVSWDQRDNNLISDREICR